MRSRTATVVTLVVLGLLTVGAIVGGLVPWYTSRPQPIPAAPTTAVPELTAPPFVSPSARRR
jgi:hypothetical protein